LVSPVQPWANVHGLRIGRESMALASASFLEAFILGIPLEFTFQPQCHVPQMAHGRYAMPNLHGEIGLFPVLNAFQEVIMFAFRIRIEMDFIRSISDCRISSELASTLPRQPRFLPIYRYANGVIMTCKPGNPSIQVHWHRRHG